MKRCASYITLKSCGKLFNTAPIDVVVVGAGDGEAVVDSGVIGVCLGVACGVGGCVSGNCGGGGGVGIG
eukprot:377263-Hanusia_phi.AAC.1